MIVDFRQPFIKGFIFCFAIVICSFIGFNIGRCSKDNTTRPVEEIPKTDSITNVNYNIKVKIEQLDSIKNAKIIEVGTLNNDSTLKLFYKLVSE